MPLPEDFDESIERIDSAKKSTLKKKYGYGSLTGQIIMSDDFNKPLEDLNDYM